MIKIGEVICQKICMDVDQKPAKQTESTFSQPDKWHLIPMLSDTEIIVLKL